MHRVRCMKFYIISPLSPCRDIVSLITATTGQYCSVQRVVTHMPSAGGVCHRPRGPCPASRRAPPHAVPAGLGHPRIPSSSPNICPAAQTSVPAAVPCRVALVQGAATCLPRAVRHAAGWWEALPARCKLSLSQQDSNVNRRDSG